MEVDFSALEGRTIRRIRAFEDGVLIHTADGWTFTLRTNPNTNEDVWFETRSLPDIDRCVIALVELSRGGVGPHTFKVSIISEKSRADLRWVGATQKYDAPVIVEATPSAGLVREHIGGIDARIVVEDDRLRIETPDPVAVHEALAGLWIEPPHRTTLEYKF